MTAHLTEQPSSTHETRVIKSHDSLDLYYEIRAVGLSQPTLFFLHGVGGDLDAWHFVQHPLLEHGVSSLAMDLRGHGYSSHPTRPESYGIHHLLQDILDVLNAEHLHRVTLIGHSFGAAVAQRFAVEHPDRLDKLVMISPIFSPPSYLRWKTSRRLAHGVTAVLAALSPRPFRPGHSCYPAGKWHKDYEWLGLARTIVHNSLKSYLLASREIINADSEPYLARIKARTLIIAGEEDSIFPIALTERLHKNIPRVRLETISRANHVVILNNADEVVHSLLSFLA
jgi:pimeloyl-ACP methyl ester carboxylesterase